MQHLGETGDAAPYSHIFGARDDNPLVYYTDIRFLVPTSIDKLRNITGARGADRGRMREAYTALTNADPMTSLSIQDICLPFLADMGEDSWQTGTGLNENEIIVEVTMAVNPARVWKAILEPTVKEVFDSAKGQRKEPQRTCGATSSWKTKRFTQRWSGTASATTSAC